MSCWPAWGVLEVQHWWPRETYWRCTPKHKKKRRLLWHGDSCRPWSACNFFLVEWAMVFWEVAIATSKHKAVNVLGGGGLSLASSGPFWLKELVRANFENKGEWLAAGHVALPSLDRVGSHPDCLEAEAKRDGVKEVESWRLNLPAVVQ